MLSLSYARTLVVLFALTSSSVNAGNTRMQGFIKRQAPATIPLTIPNPTLPDDGAGLSMFPVFKLPAESGTGNATVNDGAGYCEYTLMDLQGLAD